MSKGRSQQCIQHRNLKLAARFYFYSSLIGLKFSLCLDHLHEEFDIKEATITDVLADNSSIINNLERKNISIAQLKKTFPYLNWQYNHAKRSHNTDQLLLVLS